jgi:hypothetical protein
MILPSVPLLMNVPAFWIWVQVGDESAWFVRRQRK